MQQRNNQAQIRSEALLKFETRHSLFLIRNEALHKFETRLRLQNSKHWESPKLELSKSQNSSTNSRIYESLKPKATRFDSIEFVPLSRSFLASQVQVFDVSLSKPRGCDRRRSRVPSFYTSWLLLVTNTRSREQLYNESFDWFNFL